ncbi:COP9 signalosome complex subunit 4-like [Glossina fuscipes fuscipes]
MSELSQLAPIRGTLRKLPPRWLRDSRYKGNEHNDPVQAEFFINRASLLQAETNNEEMQILYKVCYARVLDYRRKFIEAAQRYNELSYRSIVDEGERMTALKKALICTVLASAGQQRSRMLAALFKDERCQLLPAYSILEKMYLDHIIRRSKLYCSLMVVLLYSIALWLNITYLCS